MATLSRFKEHAHMCFPSEHADGFIGLEAPIHAPVTTRSAFRPKNAGNPPVALARCRGPKRLFGAKSALQSRVLRRESTPQLRNFTANLQPFPSDSTESTRRPPISEEHMRRLTRVLWRIIWIVPKRMFCIHFSRVFDLRFVSRWVGHLRTVGIQRDAQLTSRRCRYFGRYTRSMELQPSPATVRSPLGLLLAHYHLRLLTHSLLLVLSEVPLSSPFSASSTTWGSNSIPSTPGGDTFSLLMLAGGTASAAMTIPIEAMSLSSRYETPRSGILCLADELCPSKLFL